ncbi:hypothetical protein ACFP1I_20675 [Dyadobacter subterraneus]|uniref:Prevent-host-death protein n=1 Tax=Dyadobacter subterraneus TaxID=2773304 RepID=A0ABR9W700_9BACT|nr:hypothetical protein [Dyadobacter subterraneus]MBE9461247.1 hypothetical protein [Dyadobacter subterraneus]
MQHTFKINTENLNEDFIKTLQSVFGKQEIIILANDQKSQKPTNQKEIYRKSLEIRERFKNMNVDPNLDLSSLADDINL